MQLENQRKRADKHRQIEKSKRKREHNHKNRENIDRETIDTKRENIEKERGMINHKRNEENNFTIITKQPILFQLPLLIRKNYVVP